MATENTQLPAWQQTHKYFIWHIQTHIYLHDNRQTSAAHVNRHATNNQLAQKQTSNQLFAWHQISIRYLHSNSKASKCVATDKHPNIPMATGKLTTTCMGKLHTNEKCNDEMN